MSAIKKIKHQDSSEDLLIKNLQELMQQKGINEAELSRQTNISQSTLHKILSGKTNDPRISTLKILANYFELTLDDLYSANVLLRANFASQWQSIPVISWEDCIKTKYPTATLSPTNWGQWIVVDHVDGKHTYGLATKSCMQPRFPKGTILIVDPEIQAVDGDLVIAQYRDVPKATLREMLIDGPNKLLISLNQNIPPDKLEGNIKVIGTVVQSRFSYLD